MAPQQELVCECDVSQKGRIFCERHGIEKNQTLRKLCQAGQRGEKSGVRYWQTWEKGQGARQGPPRQPAKSVRQSPRGCGDHLHITLAEKFGEHINAGCNCGAWIARMNRWGPARCRANILAIVSHLFAQAAKRKIKRLLVPVEKLPGARLYVRRLVERAIRRAETEAAKWAARPKIVFYTHGLNCGGAERWVVDLARNINPEKLAVRVVVGQSCKCVIDPALGAKARQAVPVITDKAAGRKAIDESDVTVFWNEGPQGNPGAWVFCAHGAGAWTEEFLGRVMARPKIRLTAVSQMAADSLGIHATVIYNGSDPSRLVPCGGRRKKRERLGVKPGEILVGYIGRLVLDKHPRAAAEAAASLNRRGVRARAMCVCGTQGPEKERLTVPGDATPIIVSRTEELGDLYAAMDCFVLASDSEGFSLAMIEAWMCGVPVVATPVGAVPELEERYGRLVVRVPIGADGPMLAAAVVDAINDRAMVGRAKAIARREFTTEAMGARWTEYLLGIANR